MISDRKIPLGALLICLCGSIQAADHAHDAPSPVARPSAQEREKLWKAALAKPSFAVTTAFDERGRLWRVSVRDGHVLVNYSDNNSASWSAPVKVNAEVEGIAADGENRPKIIARKGVVYVSYTQALEKPMTGHIRFSRSLDDGRSFSAPITVNDNPEIISHRFEALGVNEKGQIFLAWLDKRDLSAAASRGEKYSGVGVYSAVSDDGGVSFRPNVRAAEHSCECCRVAMAMDTDGVPVILWRHIFGRNTRDHALLRLDEKSALVRASFDNWQVDGCPHHGPALSIAADGVYHLAWFNNAPQRHGLFYARSADRGKTFSAPRAFGNFDAQAGHASILSQGDSVFVAWREFDGENNAVYVMASADGGANWSPARKMASSSSNADYPLLVARGKRTYLTWNTGKEGLRLIAVDPEAGVQ